MSGSGICHLNSCVPFLLWQANKFERPLGFFHSNKKLVTRGQLLLYLDVSFFR